ncbi:FBD-associated F-box protein At5g44490-like [Cryptomeria japonica]|uniref:FBD-associated F-box protein At5g44490-like n=1 Tax=Cryptomeria japonica TaxID=3369 RepID=UPI0027DA8491|nr:FBD-associated F-box protein At5g44490-like [Cryptomeria japonica]
MGKVDLINFPDDLFCSQILTRLPLKEAVRFSAVSRKWCRAWTRLPHLNFSHEFLNSICATLAKIKAVFELTRQEMAIGLINKILMQCVGLETFELYNCDECKSSIHKWLLWISVAGVKCINLACNRIRMEVSESIFSCVTLTSLSLEYLKMTKVPPLFQGFPQLVTCEFQRVELSEQAFEVILKLCHLLQSLTVIHCVLPSTLRIISSSLKRLVIRHTDGEICSMEANCPRLEIIKIIGFHSWRMANVYLHLCVHLETKVLLLKYFETVKLLKKTTCLHAASFSCVKDLADSTLTLPNLKTFILNMRSSDRNAVLWFSCVLKSAPLENSHNQHRSQPSS